MRTAQGFRSSPLAQVTPVAAGALLLLGCDHRVGPDADVKIGLNEVAIGLTLPDWALTIAQERLSRRHLQASVGNARLHDGRGAVDAGFLDAAVAPDAVLDTRPGRRRDAGRARPHRLRGHHQAPSAARRCNRWHAPSPASAFRTGGPGAPFSRRSGQP